jgi:hypothetical protein
MRFRCMPRKRRGWGWGDGRVPHIKRAPRRFSGSAEPRVHSRSLDVPRGRGFDERPADGVIRVLKDRLGAARGVLKDACLGRAGPLGHGTNADRLNVPSSMQQIRPTVPQKRPSSPLSRAESYNKT